MRSFLFILSICSTISLAGQENLDLIIDNARIVDGSGNPWFRGAVGIKDGKIVKLGNLKAYTSPARIDAKNQIVAPGFIDVHGHLEASILQRPQAENFIYDGVTSVITGNCGGSRTDMSNFFSELEEEGISINVGALIGHNSVRRAVMGAQNRNPTVEELQAMEALVEQAMQDGAVGFSTGLIYVPGTYSETAEVVALAKVAARYNGVYASHIRDESIEIIAAIEEAVNIGRSANMPVEISHFKLASKTMWTQSTMTVALIEQYRKKGIDVTVDQYPYPASSTTLAVLVPTWALAGGTDSLNIRLRNPEIKAQVLEGMKDILANAGFDDYTYAAVANCSWEPRYNGKRIPEISKLMNASDELSAQMETILTMVGKGNRVQMVFHKMSEEDVKYIMRYPYTMIASDAGIPQFGYSMPHPRAYGTNSRVLGHYVRELNNLELEDAIRKMTSLPAQRFQLSDRGLLRPGMAADIVIFDPDTVTDKASFDAPHAYAEGFSYVIVNGQVVVEKGKHLGTRSGQVLRLD